MTEEPLVTAFSLCEGFTPGFRNLLGVLTANIDVFSHTFIVLVVMNTVFDNAFYAA